MTAFPTFTDLARADIEEVMQLWSGLGYYSRGRKLLEAANWVLEHGIPDDVAGWKKVPGCGDYTAGAVSR
jgi:A/G-specific adenine glycosylase